MYKMLNFSLYSDAKSKIYNLSSYALMSVVVELEAVLILGAVQVFLPE